MKHLTTEEDQQELLETLGMKDRKDLAHPANDISVTTPQKQSLSAVDPNQWITFYITADTEACDPVMLMDGRWSGIEIVPSAMSRNQEEYTVASAASIPNLGERHLAIWTENDSAPQLMAIQVAEVHKSTLR